MDNSNIPEHKNPFDKEAQPVMWSAYENAKASGLFERSAKLWEKEGAPNIEEQLAAHKTRKPVINDLNDKICKKKEREYDDVLEQMQRVFDYCKACSISTDELIEQHDYLCKMNHTMLKEAIEERRKK